MPSSTIDLTDAAHNCLIAIAFGALACIAAVAISQLADHLLKIGLAAGAAKHLVNGGGGRESNPTRAMTVRSTA